MIRKITIIPSHTAFRLTILAIFVTALRVPGGEPAHWAFRQLLAPDPPVVGHEEWVRNDLDRFALAGSRDETIASVPAATRHVLLRRSYFDLIGLPPTPAQVEAFLSDQSPGAWKKVIKELLDSPQYGERWGRHWLDLARYGDSNGGDENHAYPLAWRYRNWVIDSFNRDMSFREFVQLQLLEDPVRHKYKPVSYTHLTLPTKA